MRQPCVDELEAQPRRHLHCIILPDTVYPLWLEPFRLAIGVEGEPPPRQRFRYSTIAL